MKGNSTFLGKKASKATLTPFMEPKPAVTDLAHPYSVKVHVTESEPHNTYLTLGQPDLPSILKTLSSTNDPVEIHFCCRSLRKILSTFSTEQELREMLS